MNAERGCPEKPCRGALLLAVFAMMACGAEPDPVRLEVFSWWQEESERRAFESVITLHEERQDEVEVINLYRSDAQISRAEVTKRVLAGAPPSTFQANIGADLLRWAAVDPSGPEPANESRVSGLDELFRSSGLYQDLPPELLAALRLNARSEPVAVPINIHRVNVLYYSVAREQAYRDSHGGRSFLDLDVLCPGDGAPDTRPDLVVGAGTQAAFVLTLLAFENVLPALTSAGFYDELFHGRANGDWEPEVERALECVQYLSRAFVPNHARLTWAHAVDQVARGQADFTVMGDWANGVLRAALERDEVRAVPFPGTEGIFVFTSDTFPLPVGAPHPERTRELLFTIASRQAQERFSAEKGSIPSRIALDAASAGRYSARAQDFDSATKLLATSGLFPPYYPVSQLEDALARMVLEGAGPSDVQAALALFRDAEPLFARWQNRLANGPATAAK
jgi:glucose/mannose transport system substrate-binding protein